MYWGFMYCVLNQTKMRKTIILLLATYCLISLSGCKLNTQEYNDKIVEALDLNGTTIEATITAYDESIPNLVTEKSEIDTLAMEEALSTAKKEVVKAKELLDLESKDIAQQEEVQEELTTYVIALEAYLTKYTAMTEYYSNASYVDNPNLVSEYDTELYDTDNLFDTFLESNNALAEILKSHI